jgi:hypothetical protein
MAANNKGGKPGSETVCTRCIKTTYAPHYWLDLDGLCAKG